MTGSVAVPGGIASSNRNVLPALIQLAEERHRSLTIVSYLEGPADRPASLPDWVRFEACRGSRIALTARLLGAAPARPLFVIDFVGLARPLLPLTALGLARTVIFAHGCAYWRDVRWSHRRCIETATLCLTNSLYTLEKMRAAFPGFAGRPCLLGLTPEFRMHAEVPAPSRQELSLEASDGRVRRLGDRVLLLTARMDPTERQKGHDRLLRALPGILALHPEVQVVFVGPGEDRGRLEAISHQLGVAHAVFFTGRIELERLELLYRRCFAFVMPSTQEGFGLVYLEAMNAARPCVGCREQGTEDVVVHGETGLLLRDAEDARELAAAVGSLLDRPEWAQQLGRNGFERLHTAFTAAHHQARVRAEIAPLL